MSSTSTWKSIVRTKTVSLGPFTSLEAFVTPRCTSIFTRITCRTFEISPFTPRNSAAKSATVIWDTFIDTSSSVPTRRSMSTQEDFTELRTPFSISWNNSVSRSPNVRFLGSSVTISRLYYKRSTTAQQTFFGGRKSTCP